MYTIKQVSEKLKVQANAIRFYEKKGLLIPNRGNNNYREYSIEDISRLEMIILYRKMGFSIDSIRMLLQDKKNPELLNQYVAQYNILNHHIHTMCSVRETLGKCVEDLLNGDSVQTEMIKKMEKTAEIIASSNEWEDKWHFDSWAEHYDRDIRRKGKGLDFYCNYDKVIEMTVQNIKGPKVAEIGIGTGNLAKVALESGIECNDYVGVDQSLNMLKEAKKKCPDIELRLGEYLQLPLDNNIYDTVVTSYAFHHCDHDEKVLAIKEMDKVLSHHGRIIITDLMFENEEKRNRYEDSCSKESKEDLLDEYFGNVDEVEEMFIQQGFHCKKEQIDELIWIIVAQRV
ncbi:MerR family transcriptional regulator [Anaeromicropila herbilytica]|uniref:HTH merR-type domain-containing protein n=1 Tax=Anaeromicropila herbilytica TaxID=2785025 RepID=A0A7R7EI41_9FIRM|nr:MerR family transcriptional regulator [Anaeromicropila herbilytica]BCN29099.1 hypothetical protein bsdtb5_03940 [Anaeromicropila herbilytica]